MSRERENNVAKVFDVFLSHNSKDKPWVVQLKTDLQNFGIKVWLDKDEIRPGDLFTEALEKGIQESKAVALIISPESMRSGWVNAEYRRALNLATSGELQLIPVLYRKAEIPGFLSDRSWVDFSNESEYAEQLQRLRWGITGEKPEEKPVPRRTRMASLLASANEIVNQQSGRFSSGSSFYPDQCELALRQIERLDGIVETIHTLLPSNYNAYTVITGLTSQVKMQRDLLADFRKTCPPGDNHQREALVNHLNSIKDLLNSVNNVGDQLS